MRLMKGFTIELDKDGYLKTNLRFPCLASFKLDGIRAAQCQELGFQSNSGKPFPSKYVQELAKQLPYLGLDGEFVYGDPSDEHCCNKTQSAVMSIEWPADLDKSELRYYVFDVHNDPQTFAHRIDVARLAVESVQANCPWVGFVEHPIFNTSTDLKDFYEHALAEGFEGIIYRHPHRAYKQGRSTEKEGGLGKLKPFGKELFEARIVGWYPQLQALSSEFNELGYLKASKAADNVVTIDAIGGFYVEDCKTGVAFKLGGGKLFTKRFRQDMFKNVESLIGKIIQYKCMTYGQVEAPRQPTAYRFRDPIDMTNY